jgi:outer membrane receptor protein involved in Fe transport
MASPTKRHADFRRSPLHAALALSILISSPTLAVSAQTAQKPNASTSIDIPAENLDAALEKLSTQTGIQFVYDAKSVAGRQAKALTGRLTWTEALDRLLQGTGLEYRQISDATVVIRPSGQPVEKGAEPAAAPTSKGKIAGNAPIANMEATTVTGTRIRGGTTPSPVITIGAENIQEEGFSDLGQVIRSVPQNFNGGQNPGVIALNLAGGGVQNANLTGGSSLNLRGLGPDATLTLLNGRRMAYGGFVQAIDISAIPVEAVERIEIVADGASAIYGSDAVGGVGNVVLRRDFDGFTVGTRYGTATDGGAATREYTATGGTTWSSGGVIATYKRAFVDPIYARQRDYTDDLTEPYTLYPGSDSSNALLSAHQSMGDKIELHLDAVKNKRNQHYSYVVFGTLIGVAGESKTSLISPSVDLFLPNDWTLSVAGTFAKDEYQHFQSDDDLTTGIPEDQDHDAMYNKSHVYEASAEGPVFELSGGDARLAVGMGYRTNSLLFNRHITEDSVVANGDNGSRFAYAEISLPLVGSESDNITAPRLEATAALRTEDYNGYGRVTTPKLGLIYDPNADFTLKASWGKSFKMPTLYQLHQTRFVAVDHPSYYGGTDDPPTALAMEDGGGNPNLGPERARTWTTSLLFHPAALPGLETELTWFDIDYSDRVVNPILAWYEALTNPIYAPFVHYAPTVEKLAEVVAQADSFTNYADTPYDPANVVALIDTYLVNASHQRIKGLDLSGSYLLDVGPGSLTIRGSASWLDSTQQVLAGQEASDLAGTLFNPPKLNGRLGAVWNRGGFSASAFANYIGGVTDTLDRRKGASFTTLDAVARYNIGIRHGAWSNVEVALSAQNLFDRHPPLYSVPESLSSYVPAYDSNNYSPIGRFVSLSVSKHW